MNWKSILTLSSILLILLGNQGCGSPPGTDSDPVVAEVFGQRLYASDLSELIPSSPSPEDSVARANAYIEQWVREKLMLHEAEKNLPTDINIEKLVHSYRASLLKFYYEKKIIEEALDSSITHEQLETFYEDNKSQYLLKEPILKAQIAILNIESDGNSRMKTLWSQDEWEQIKSLCSQKSCVHYSDGSSWISLNEFRNVVPVSIMSYDSVINGRKIQEQSDSYEFYLKITDFKDENETPPLDYIRNQLTKVILHKRKQRILMDLSEKLYQDELKKNNIKIHVQS